MEDFKAWVDELLGHIDLVAVISRYVPLKKKGGNWWGCCPFHHEKEPSFSVNAAQQFYHCFGCKESGNAITFLQKMENVDRFDAIKLLAEEARLEMPRLSGSQPEAVSREKKDRLLGLMKTAARHYHENLYSPAAKKAREYLERREVDESLIKKFGLGYAVNGREMLSYLESAGYSPAEMKEAGIAEQRGDEYYDVYYARLMFPIINNLGEVIAFGGRTLEADANFAKYRNTSQTVLFDKSKSIYAINLLKKRKQRAGLEYMIMTEGYMDVIALHKAGFDTAVASMGTALTWQQAKTLKNYCDRIYISYDGDAAGQKATMRGLDILAQAGLSVRVVKLPDGLDPDDVIRQKGRAFYAQLLTEAQTLPQFKINTLKNGFDLADTEGRSKFAVEAIKVVKALDNPVEQAEYVDLIGEITGYRREVLLKQIDITVAEPAYAPPEPEKQPAPEIKVDRAKLFVLASLAHGKEYVDYTDDLSALMDNECERQIYGSAVERVRTGVYKSPTGLFSSVPEAYSGELAEVVGYTFVDGDGKEKYDACVSALKMAYIESEKERLAAAFDKEDDKEKRREMLTRIAELETAKTKLRLQGR